MKPNYKALSKRLTTIQFPNTRTASSRLVDNELIIEEYRQRTYATRGKITKILLPFQMGQAYNDDVRNLLDWLQDAIGVYDVPPIVPSKHRRNRQIDRLWTKMTTNVDGGFEGNYWHDYLGDKNIATTGGRVVVVLSDEGVKWLNEIADKVKEYIPSDVPTAKPTNEKNDHENEQDEFFEELLKRFDSLFED